MDLMKILNFYLDVNIIYYHRITMRHCQLVVVRYILKTYFQLLIWDLFFLLLDDYWKPKLVPIPLSRLTHIQGFSSLMTVSMICTFIFICDEMCYLLILWRYFQRFYKVVLIPCYNDRQKDSSMARFRSHFVFLLKGK